MNLSLDSSSGYDSEESYSYKMLKNDDCTLWHVQQPTVSSGYSGETEWHFASQ